MKLTKTLFVLLPLVLLASFAGGAGAQDAPKAGDSGKYVYADFETEKDGRPLGVHGGIVQLVAYSENASNPAKYKGLANANPPAPELVRLKKDDPNHAVAFDYELTAPNQWAGVGVEVQGEPFKDGKPVAADLSAYKDVTMQIYATGVTQLRFEIMSRGQGLGDPQAYPQTTFKVTPGFNTYRIPLKSLAQPQWAQPRLSPKDVLKKLTAVNVSAFCNNCTAFHGTVILDNIVFEN